MNSQRPRTVIIGGGGHARVVIEALQLANSATLVGVLDNDSSRHGQLLLDVPILGSDDLLPSLLHKEVTHFVIGVGGIGSNEFRRKLFVAMIVMGLKPLTVCHPAAICSAHATIGAGCQILAGAIINVGAVLGQHVIVNTGAIVEHDCVLGDHVHVATGARLAGTIHVGNGAHIGAGATVRQSLTIGAGALVGAGAVVVRNVADNQVVVGVPARELKRD